MAHITRIGPFRHLRAEASSHVLHYRRAKLVRSARGLSFWFRAATASIAEVPVDDRELQLLFHGRTADFQDVAVEGVLTFRAIDPERLADRIDFTIDLDTGAHRRQPLDRLALMMSQLAQQHAVAALAAVDLRAIVLRGPAELRLSVGAGLSQEPSIADFGLALVSVRISSVRPLPEVERALEAPSREKIQEEADQAAFARRAMAVENERAIEENELKNKIELARRTQALIEQEGANFKRKASEDAEAKQVIAQAAAERDRIAAHAKAEVIRTEADARAEEVRAVEGARVVAERDRIGIYRELSAGVLLGLAARDLAGNLPKIDHLHLGTAEQGHQLGELVSSATRKLETSSAE
jgi:regulator of protease activity HflC (stomatin/prohibitin superfamily)